MTFSMHMEDLKAFWVAFIVSAILSKPILNLLIKAKSRQTVSSHLEGHAAKQGTPTMGGMIILLGVLFAAPFCSDFVSLKSSHALYVLILLFALIGFIDDYVIPRLMPAKRGLGWKQKILMQVVAATVPFLIANEGSYFVHFSPLQIGFGVFCILFFANAFNFADGLDGLAGLILIGQLLGLVFIPAAMGSWYAPTQLYFSLFGGLVVFLFWNAPKARIFMGDVGSLPIGALLGGSWFFVTAKWSDDLGTVDTGLPWTSYLIPVLIWSIPMICELVPVPLQVFSVKVFKKKLFPFTPIHHAFEEIKLKPGETESSDSYIQRKLKSPRWAYWPETRIVFSFAIFQLLCSMLAITVALMTKPN